MLKIRRVLSLMLAVLMIFSLSAFSLSAFAEEEQAKTTKLQTNFAYVPKIINIVYDDSGSMVNGDEKDAAKGHIKRWAQAKYALEVFVSMMEDKDKINVFTMSDADNGLSKPRLAIKGADKTKSVKDIHNNFKTGDYSVGTPIAALDNAYKNLPSGSTEEIGAEKWMIVLTDGVFTDKSGKPALKEAKAKLTEYGKKLMNDSSDHKIHLIYIPIETSSDAKYKSEYFTTYGDTSIMESLLSASQQIYTQRDAMDDFNASSGTINTGGISMSKLILFLQGTDVKISGITEGKVSQNISVKYTEPKNAVKYGGSNSFKPYEANIKTDTSLTGIVAVIEPKDGDYITSESGEIKLTYGDKTKVTYSAVYYVPAVEIKYSLEDSKENVWLSSDSINAAGTSISPGEYTFKAEIVDSGTKKGGLENNPKIADLALNVTINGTTYDISQLKDGVKVSFTSGQDLSDVKADASIMSGKYSVDTSDLMKAFKKCVVKTTYSLKVKIEKTKKATPLDFRFKKVDFLLGQIKSIGENDTKNMLKATVSCYDESGQQVPLTDEIWAKVIDAYNNKGSSTDGTSIYVGNPKNDKKTNVKYDLFFNGNVNSDGNGEFFIRPKYAPDKNGKPDKKHTTHLNFTHSEEKNTCRITAEINIPNVTDTLSYSTTPTIVEDKSAPYTISISMWWTIGIIFLFLWNLGYLLKKRIPSDAKFKIENTRNFQRGRDEFGEMRWQARRVEEESDARVRKTLGTRLLPWVSQRGEIEFDFPMLNKIRVVAEDFGKGKVKLLNKPDEFAGFGVQATPGGNPFFNLDGDYLTEETYNALLEESGTPTFNINGVVIIYGGTAGNRFTEYHASYEDE